MLREEVKVLVVEDVDAMRVQIKSLLRLCGFTQITLCESVKKACIALEDAQYQLILCDWHLDGITDGLDLLKHVRGTPKVAATGFIMVTAEGTRERVIEAIQCGVDDYLLKPLTVAQIQDKVFGLLLRKQVL